MRVKLRNPDREIEVVGDRKVRDVLAELGLNVDTVLVIRRRDLPTRQEPLSDADEIEIERAIERYDMFSEVAREMADEVLPSDIYTERTA